MPNHGSKYTNRQLNTFENSCKHSTCSSDLLNRDGMWNVKTDNLEKTDEANIIRTKLS